MYSEQYGEYAYWCQGVKGERKNAVYNDTKYIWIWSYPKCLEMFVA